ncbi:glycosyltransferase [Stieleria sp. ICT_E10.1]|uniref:glycosyltransferase n=1 Tax=Stieleria sedimenti TaxID=2976331 RepID=UPI00218033F4|nr:glycosyltransferase [Stieleria sedimenti]MCS7466763.1 glycosyltransferase [Stieleria sedimenti]
MSAQALERVGSVTKNCTEESIRFLHIFPEYNRGGAELRVTRTINAMGPGGGHAILSLNGRTGAASLLDPSCDVRVYKGPPKKGRVRFPVDLWRYIRDLNPSVILTYNWGATDAVLAAKFARFRPVVHNECGLSADVDGKGWRRRLMRRVLLPGCHQVVVTSHTLFDMSIEHYGVPKEKITFIKTGVDTERFSPRENHTLRNQILASNLDRVVFGYVGTLRPSKNLPMLFQAFAKAKPPNSQLAIFGDGPERERLGQLAVELGIADSVYFHGYIDKPEDAFAAIDVNVTTSRSEAASNSLLEAMATGLPVISTDIADNARMLCEKNREFVYSHENLEGYASGLHAMASDSFLRSELGRLNRSRVCKEYPIDRMYREYAELWQSVEASF